jgi:apolipoprotein N-acyltransferase
MSLVLAALLLLFSSGRWVIPIAVWLSPLFLLRFVRDGRLWPRLAIAALLLYAIGCLTWWGMVPVPPPFYFLIMVGVLLPGVLPYLAGRLLVRRGAGFLSTLVFPSAWVVTEFITTHVSPYGSWGAVAYTQVDCLPLMQSAAMTGLWGVAFLIAWTASVGNWVLENGFNWAEVRRGVLTWGGTVAAVVLMGGARMVFAPPAGPTIRVAGIVVPPPPSISPADCSASPHPDLRWMTCAPSCTLTRMRCSSA